MANITNYPVMEALVNINRVKIYVVNLRLVVATFDVISYALVQTRMAEWMLIVMYIYNFPV